MRKKVIIIIIVSVVAALLITGGVVGALFLIHGNPKQPAKVAAFDPTKVSANTDPALQESQTKPDLSVDLGACSLVTQGAIEAGLGIKTQPADNRGYGHDGGDGSQSCVFAFSADSNASNRLTVTVTKFSTQASADLAMSDYTAAEKVSDLADPAYFVSQPGDANLKQNQYGLYVFKGLKGYSFVILQPTASDAFTAASAQSDLVTIAKTATF